MGMRELMVQNLKLEDKDILVTDSREVAEMTGKEHKQLLKDIRKYNQYLNEGKVSPVEFFIESSYKDTKGETRPCYLLTRKGCDMVANKMIGKKGVLFTAAYVTKFEDMEKKLKEKETPKIPSTYKEALIALVQSIEEKEKLEAEKNKLIHQNKTYTSTEIAKELGFKSAIKFNKILEEKKIQYKVNGTWVLCARYSECGYQSIKQIELEGDKVVYDRRWTGKGRDWLVNEIFKINQQ